MHAPSLVILAAGASTRFGRPKQLEPVGPEGEMIMDITLRHAFNAGCAEARLVVRPEHEALLRTRYARERRVGLVVQNAPLGTGHAARVGMESAASTCIVVNGDDFYGRRSMEMAVMHARKGRIDEHALVAFDLAMTLSPNGAVNRAICRERDGCLSGIEEVQGLCLTPQGRIVDHLGRDWAGDTPVSMNLWVMRHGFHELLLTLERDNPVAPGQERGLPDAVREALSIGHQFRRLRTPDRWSGLTFPGDADLVRRYLAEDP